MNYKDNIDEFTESNKLMPLLFLGHGSPMNAIEENQFVDGFRNIAATLPKPSAILCISAHWFINRTSVTAMQNPRTIHDFGGFPEELYKVQYPAPGNPQLALEIQQIIGQSTVNLDEKWGLDHGAWSVIKHLYPKADIPVVQLSIDYTKPTQYHFDLAKKLSELRKKGILIIGSGNIVHNLSMVDYYDFDKDDYGFDWAVKARKILNDHIANKRYKELINYKKLGNSIKLAIPSPDHYLPLIYILALKNKEENTEFFNDKMVAGSLSMTSLKIS